MNNFDFIPNNTERNTADMNVVALFLKAFLKHERYCDSGWAQCDYHLLAAGSFVSGHRADLRNEVKFKKCDVQYAFNVLKEKGYHICVWTSPKGISTDYTLHYTRESRCRYL
jgi:hypothetical protein